MAKLIEKEWAVSEDSREGMEWNNHIVLADNYDMRVCFMAHDGRACAEEFAEAALVIAAAPSLLKAAMLLERAETAHANCPECEGDIAGELCSVCFPLFDDARIARRLALEKAAISLDFS